MPVYTEEVPIEQFGRILLEVEADFREIDFEPTMKKMLPVLEAGEASAFANESTPGGAAWKPLAPATVARKGHSKILIETGRLKKSLTGGGGDAVRATSHRGLVFGTSVPYAAYHQSGTTRIPQREHTGMSEATLNQIVNAVADAAVEALKK